MSSNILRQVVLYTNSRERLIHFVVNAIHVLVSTISWMVSFKSLSVITTLLPLLKYIPYFL